MFPLFYKKNRALPCTYLTIKGHLLFSRRVRPSVLAALLSPLFSIIHYYLSLPTRLRLLNLKSLLISNPSLKFSLFSPLCFHSASATARNITEGNPSQSRTMQKIDQRVHISNKSCNDHGYVRSSRKQLSAIHGMI